jgi:hypothetical protein
MYPLAVPSSVGTAPPAGVAIIVATDIATVAIPNLALIAEPPHDHSFRAR